MSLQLPDRASAEYLKKLAKERLALMRATDPEARLSDAQLAIARNYGFASWRALKADLDGRQSPGVAELLAACASGDVDAIRTLVTRDPALARDRLPGGTTALHLAARHPAALQLLIEHGADPNARDARRCTRARAHARRCTSVVAGARPLGRTRSPTSTSTTHRSARSGPSASGRR